MQTIKTVSDQTLINLALQEYGNVDGIADLINDNDLAGKMNQPAVLDDDVDLAYSLKEGVELNVNESSANRDEQGLADLLEHDGYRNYSKRILADGVQGLPISTDARAYFDRLATEGHSPDDMEELAVDTLIFELKGAGLWSKLIAIYPVVGTSTDTCKYNLKDPQDADSSYRLTFYNNPAVASEGIRWNGTTQYADTHIVPEVGTTNEKVSFVYYSTGRIASNSNTYEMAAYGDGTQRYEIRIVAGANTAINIATGGGTHPGAAFARPGTDGLFVLTRDDSNIYSVYNGALENTKVTGYNSSSNTDSIYLGAENRIQVAGAVSGFTDLICGFAAIGNELTSAEAITLSAIINKFMTTMGKNTY